MMKYDRRRKGTADKQQAKVVKFKGTAELMAEQMGGTAVELCDPLFVTMDEGAELSTVRDLEAIAGRAAGAK
jgi:hypothetical protein